MEQYHKCVTICQAVFVVKKDIFTFEKILQDSEGAPRRNERNSAQRKKSSSHMSDRILEMQMNENIKKSALQEP